MVELSCTLSWSRDPPKPPAGVQTVAVRAWATSAELFLCPRSTTLNQMLFPAGKALKQKLLAQRSVRFKQGASRHTSFRSTCPYAAGNSVGWSLGRGSQSWERAKSWLAWPLGRRAAGTPRF